jgi:hypothetical protein
VGSSILYDIIMMTKTVRGKGVNERLGVTEYNFAMEGMDLKDYIHTHTFYFFIHIRLHSINPNKVKEPSGCGISQ